MNSSLPVERDLSRRRFLKAGGRNMGAFFLGALAGPVRAQDNGGQGPRLYDNLDALAPLQSPDENGIRLPRGFRSREIARSGRRVLPASDYIWHDAPDGGATYARDDGWIYVSNSEIDDRRGGVGALRFNASGEIVDAYPILDGTTRNCAGGKTPWQTWLSCEEIPRGMVYECDPTASRPARARPLLGRFQHEAVAVDPVNDHLYMTEDVGNGGFYRFVPANSLPDLSAGTLEIAEVVSDPDGSRIVWHPVPEPAAEDVPTRYQVEAATPFNGGEGIAWHDAMVYFTTKGDNRVYQYDTSRGELDILYDAVTSATPHLSGVDNVVITASGDVMVAEDGGDMQIVLLSADGRAVIPVLQILDQDESEICGPAFDPSFTRLYFSSQRGAAGENGDGRIYEITYTG